jgi:hypothetical protein
MHEAVPKSSKKFQNKQKGMWGGRSNEWPTIERII